MDAATNMAESGQAEECPICGGTGWKLVERAGLSGVERCACAERARSDGLKRNSGIPLNYTRASLDNFQIPQDNPLARAGLGKVMLEVRAFVREYPLGERPGLLLSGGTGTGKTHLAVAALKALIDKGYEGLFFDYQNLLDRIRSGYNATAGASDKEAYRTAMDAEILLLDDLGAHRVNEWVEDTVTSILTYRCNHKKPLIATTNLDAAEAAVAYKLDGGKEIYRKTLGEAIGERARSRLFEMCRVIRMPEVADYRVRSQRI